jgi:hypothetical protein
MTIQIAKIIGGVIMIMLASGAVTACIHLLTKWA